MKATGKHSGSKLRTFLTELRRRQVFGTVAFYAVAAWAVIEVGDMAIESGFVTGLTTRGLFTLALIGFPLVLLAGWFYDVTKKGVFRTPPIGAVESFDNRLQTRDYLYLLMLLALWSGVYVYVYTPPVEKTVAVERRENSIAVMPFDNLDPNPETSYFSDGVADEILSRLANMQALFVVGRASSFAFRQSDEDSVTISRKLGVRYLLSGSVRRDNDIVRITARLMDEEGSHVWSQSFDRKLEHTLAIQSEIADAVARRIAKEVTTVDGSLAARGTENSEAYNNYLLGKKLLYDRPPRWREKSRQLFQSATELDTGFASAYAYLAIIIGLYAVPEDDLEALENATRTALDLDANLAEAHMAMGLLHEFRDQDPNAAIASLRRAIDINPTLSIALNKLGNVLFREGRTDEARQIWQQGLEHDPLNPVFIVNVANQTANIGEFEKAEKLMLRLLQLPQTPSFSYIWLRELYFEHGRIDEAIKWDKKSLLLQLDNISEPEYSAEQGSWFSFRLVGLVNEYLILGMEEQAEYWMDQVMKLQIDVFLVTFHQAGFCWWQNQPGCVAQTLEEIEEALEKTAVPDWTRSALGQFHLTTGSVEKGIEYLRAQVELDEAGEPILELGTDLDALRYLILGYRLTGQDEVANRLLETTAAWAEADATSNRLRVAPVLMGLALTRWLHGNYENAIEAARQAIVAGWIELYTSRLDPLMRELLAAPELREALTGVEQEIQRQRALVEAAESNDDFREEVTERLARLRQISAEQQ